MRQKNAQRELAALIDQAMQQPGVAEVMRLYEPVKLSSEAVAQVERITAETWVSTSSSSSIK